MGYCSVANCGNCSGKGDCASKRITFHCFPKDPDIKDKWILATGKKNWFPSSHSRICSIHFREDDFNPTTKRRILLEHAYPTIDVWITAENSTDNAQQSPSSTSSSVPYYGRPQDVDPNIIQIPTKMQMWRIIQLKESIINSQRLKIRRLQCKNWRCQKKINELRDLLINVDENKLNTNQIDQEVLSDDLTNDET